MPVLRAFEKILVFGEFELIFNGILLRCCYAVVVMMHNFCDNATNGSPTCADLVTAPRGDMGHDNTAPQRALVKMVDWVTVLVEISC